MKQRMLSPFVPFFAAVLILTVVGILGANNANAAEIQNEHGLVLTDQDVENLVNLGFTKEEIQYMDQEEFDRMKDVKGEVVASTTQFLKIVEPKAISNNTTTTDSQKTMLIELDEETYNKEVRNHIQPNAESDSESTSYKKMTTTITKIAYDFYQVKNSVTWTIIPHTRYIDVSGVGINQTYWAPEPNTQYGKQNWKKYSYCGGWTSGDATYTTASNKWKKGVGGYALKMNLPNEDFTGGCGAESVRELSSYMYYRVTNLAQTNQIDAFGHYAHQQSTATLEPSISLSGVSFSVTPSKEFSIHPNTHVRHLQ